MTNLPGPSRSQHSRLDEALVQPSTGQRAMEEERIREELLKVAKPDSRYQLNLDFFIPDFVGSGTAADRLIETPEYQRASRVFVTPDNALIEFRKRCLRDGKVMVLPSYGLTQGFLLVDPATINPSAIEYAAWLDGIQHFARTVTLAELHEAKPFDMVIAGAAAVTKAGLRFGMGYRYLDIEWGLLAGLGLLEASTPVATMVHEVQFSQIDLPIEPLDVTANIVALPDQMMRISSGTRLTQLDKTLLSPELAETSVVHEYHQLTHKGL